MGTPDGASEGDAGKCDHRRLVANHMGRGGGADNIKPIAAPMVGGMLG